MTTSRIHGKEYPIEEIFNGNFVFHIPRYQRPYAWESEQAQPLLEDLLAAVGDLDNKDDDVESYFLGSIVVVKDEHEKDAEVVDGQQRLTTLTLLLAAIRALTQDDDGRAELTEMIYKKGKRITNTPDHFHLSLRDRDAEFFQNNIQKDIKLGKLNTINLAELPESQKNIVLNAKKYLEMLSSFTQKQLQNLATYIVTHTFLIVVSTPNIDSAYRIFSVLNDRGLDLSYTDICKANVIGQIKESLQDTYTKKWEESEERVGRDGFKEVFSHIRTVHRKARIKDTILKELQEHVLSASKPEDFIDNVLLPYTNAYDTIRTASFESERLAENVNNTLTWLNRIDNTDWMPAALNFYNPHKHNPEKLLQFLVDLERLAASMMIRRENVNTRQMRYIGILNAIDNGDDLSDPASPLQLSPKEKQATIERLEGDIYNNGSRLYILRHLDAEHNETHTTPELPIITVEHVLPQNPGIGGKWMEWYPNEEERKIWVHRLGNLALLSRRKNSQAQNFEFDRKKQLYFNSPLTPFALTTLIIRQSAWTKDILEKRQKESVKILKSLWRL